MTWLTLDLSFDIECFYCATTSFCVRYLDIRLFMIGQIFVASAKNGTIRIIE